MRLCINCSCIEDNHFDIDWYFEGMATEDPTQINQCGDCADCYEPKFEGCPNCLCPEDAHKSIDPYWTWYSRGTLHGYRGCMDCGKFCDPEDDGPQIKGGVAARVRPRQ